MINTNLMMIISHILLNLIDVICVILPVLLGVAFMTIIERKQLAAHQRRVGPVKWFGKSLLWVKLSNFGDTLKTIVPNYNRKSISGWSHYSCTVISYSMSENKMGNRGSKSEFQKNI
jgi:NADH:ubiquinone oxidoreductase subunit H